MDDPLADIPKIIPIILGSGPKNQKYYAEGITKYYHENVEYKSFMDYIPSGRKSRDSFIALNRFYRGFVWNDKSQIHDIWYNEDSLKAVVDVTQTVRKGIFFWKERRNRFMIKLELFYKHDGSHVIRRQEILMQPEVFAGTVIPVIVPAMITLQKFLLGIIAIVIGRCLELIGCS